MNAYHYTPKYRPPSEVTVPRGWEIVERGKYTDGFNKRSDLPIGQHPFGVIRYRRPLTDEEREQYELEIV